MKRLAATLLTALAAVTWTMGQPEWPTVTNETRAGSRWWWMGSAVSEDGLDWNMEQCAKAGIGTLEITPIYGVKGNSNANISFLSPRWLDMLRCAVEKGRQYGVSIDMTTGTGWPFGGPMVKREESASKLVTQELTLTGDGTTEHTLTLNGGGGSTLQRVLAFPVGSDGGPVDLTAEADGLTVKWVIPAGQWRVIAVFCQFGVMQVKRPAPGSEGLVVDHFDAEAVANYLSWFDKRFEGYDGPWPRSFFNDSYEITQADWTRDMFGQFQKYRGYRLEDVMDKLIDKDPQVLADYRQTLSDMLLNNFTRQWTQWAHSHGATTRSQAHGSPGNLIDLYAAADIPETESFYMTDFGIRGLRRDEGFTLQALSSLPTLKYASSAAHITGKPVVSSESLTWLTEHFRTSLSQIKPELDQLFTAGVNRVMFHGTTYSPREAPWPGWKFYAAIDMSLTNSIWRDVPELTKYIERVQSFMLMGQPDNDLLVYAPFANAMHKKTGSHADRLLLFDINNMDSRMPELAKCVNAILEAGLDCDYTSDHYLMQTTFTDGQLQTAAGTRYRALVVPTTADLPDSVRQHLDELAEQGAKIVYDYAPGTIATLGVTGEELRSAFGLKMIRRRNTGGFHYFIANLTPNDVEDYVSLAIPFQSVVIFDPLTGKISDSIVKNGKVYVSLKSGQSVILQTYDTAVTVGAAQLPVSEVTALKLGGQWRLSFTDDSTPGMAGKTYELDGPQPWQTLDSEAARLMGTGVYETTFQVTAQQMAIATGGFRLNLGDVRESARVWLNGEYIGCAWCVPYTLDCQGLVHEGDNTLRIEVTNLPANRIRQMDIDGTEWRIFEDTNINSISNSTNYTKWELMPSGLNSPVSLVPLAVSEQAMTARLKEMRLNGARDEEGGEHYEPVYLLSTHNAHAISSVQATDQDGRPFAGIAYTINDDGTAELTITDASAAGDIIVCALDGAGTAYYAYLPAYGPYIRDIFVDFTAENEPLGGWQKLATTGTIKGFESLGKQEWYRSKLNGKTVTLYDGVTFNSAKSNYYFYFLGYGMNANNDFNAHIDALPGDVAQLEYMVGGEGADYDADQALTRFAICDEGAGNEGISLDMPGNSSYYVYRSLSVYRPVSVVGVKPVTVSRSTLSDTYYNLHGQQVARPNKGVYIKNGRKVIIIDN